MQPLNNGGKTMERILKDLDECFKLISSVPVSGESVDMIAAARNKLRKIYAELKNAELKDKGETDNG
jgi:hypothetical protein